MTDPQSTIRSPHSLKVSAPGRICLFGEHQDFLGLPVVAAAINLRFYIEGTPRNDSLIEIDMPDIGAHESIDLSGELIYTIKRDYLRSCINVLRRTGWQMTHGWDCTYHSTIPINAGVSSSSAMIVTWLRFLEEAVNPSPALPAAGRGRHLTPSGGESAHVLPPRGGEGWGGVSSPEDLARLAHQAEVVEFGEPGGMMDHFAAALGGFIYVDCRPPFKAEHLPIKLDGFVLGDSLEKKDTLGTLGGSRNDVHVGLEFLAKAYPGFDLHTTPKEEVWDLLDRTTENVRRKVRANLINRDITVRAMEMFRSGSVNPPELGCLLYKHHQQLRDGIGVSTPKIDAMLEAAMEAGALGGKINGSGGGGCMFVYAPGREDEAAEALERAGGKAYKLTIDTGARVDE